MIQYLTHDQLDIKKYDACIEAAINSRIYAYSWVLSITCDSWDVLVFNDYKAVMPLPKRVKYGLNYIYLAPWTQQLGVFSSEEIDQQLFEAFIEAIPKKFKLVELFFNAENNFTYKGLKQRINYILSLELNYDQIATNFSKGRKSDIKQAIKNELQLKKCDVVQIIALFEKNKGVNLKIKKSDYRRLAQLIKEAQLNQSALCYGVFNKNNQLIGAAIFLIDKSRITYLFSAINQEGRQKKAMSFLLANIINMYAGSGLYLDFEGSMIKEIAAFFKSFGAKTETYFHLKKISL